MFTVDIDTGGTMTDALVSDGTARHAFKVDTTPHDYTVSFLACLQEAAEAMKFPTLNAFLRKVHLIRWSSTITTNVLAERRGSKVGLFVSKGQEQMLYGTGRSPIVGELVTDGAVLGLPADPTPADVLSAVKKLLEAGVRRICVSLAEAFPNNASETAIKDMIEDQYPDHIIGAIPVLLGSEMAPVRHDQTRAHYSVMNAYTHAQLANSLFKAEDLLRDEHGWNRALLIGHTSGGVARIGKTKAVDTIESGPVFGTFGGQHMASLYGFGNAVCFDVGGTTTKASIVRDGVPVFQRGGELMDVPVQTSFAMLRSAAIGGGSIVRVLDGSVALGPESMGAAPGPACYDLGGDHATLTDALLFLGYLDPAIFLGGRRPLRVDLARGAIENNVAKALGVSVDAAALAIRDEAVAMMTSLVGSALREAGIAAGDTPLFAYGGNGPMFATFVADQLRMPAAVVFGLGPVFSTFGSAISDVVHRYERDVDLALEAAPGSLPAIVDALQTQAERDLRGEGFEPQRATFRWEAEVGTSATDVSTAGFDGEAGQAPSLPAVRNLVSEAAGPLGGVGTRLLRIKLATRYPIGSHGVTKRTERVASEAPRTREARFVASDREEVRVYRWEALNPGDAIPGPAVVNGATMTCTLPAGWRLTVDDYGNARMHRP